MSKTKKPKSEALMKSILEDLQADHEEPSARAKDFGASILEHSDDSDDEKPVAHPEDEERFLPEGLESETAIFGFSQKAAKAAKTQAAKLADPVPAVIAVQLPEAPEPSASLANFPSPTAAGAGAPSGFEPSITNRLVEQVSSAIFNTDYMDRTQPMPRPGQSVAGDMPVKVSHGVPRPLTKSSASAIGSSTESQMQQAETLRLAQARILELEKETEELRAENELLASAGDIAKNRTEELVERSRQSEQAKIEALEQAQMEINIYRENLVEKERELSHFRHKVEDLETRLAKDLKKIRIRERELENRLELSKMEKTALLRAKDEAILDLKGRVDQLQTELESARNRSSDLTKKVDGQHEQLGRTVRALRLALTHLEANEMASSLVPLKKAE